MKYKILTQQKWVLEENALEMRTRAEHPLRVTMPGVGHVKKGAKVEGPQLGA